MDLVHVAHEAVFGVGEGIPTSRLYSVADAVLEAVLAAQAESSEGPAVLAAVPDEPPRVVADCYLPLSVDTFARITRALHGEFPHAVVGRDSDGDLLRIMSHPAPKDDEVTLEWEHTVRLSSPPSSVRLNGIVYGPDGRPVDPSLDPAWHCFREDGCRKHEVVRSDPERCCCCGQPATAHTGCDCSPEAMDAAAIEAEVAAEGGP